MSSLIGARPAALQVSEEKYSAGLANDATGLKVAFKGTISTVNPAAVLNPFVDRCDLETFPGRTGPGAVPALTNLLQDTPFMP